MTTQRIANKGYLAFQLSDQACQRPKSRPKCGQLINLLQQFQKQTCQLVISRGVLDLRKAFRALQSSRTLPCQFPIHSFDNAFVSMIPVKDSSESINIAKGYVSLSSSVNMLCFSATWGLGRGIGGQDLTLNHSLVISICQHTCPQLVINNLQASCFLCKGFALVSFWAMFTPAVTELRSNGLA